MIKEKGVAAPFLFLSLANFFGKNMTINELWYLIIFAWGIACGWAVVNGINNQ
ncbi:hypothetical protein KDM87_03665 [Undibacterium sp. FT147W]|uniref:Uncharacterized protein n=1 Tax=Undibacterium rivi TaxID=2828729 RepID=A0ABS5GZ18_9BURK|nr:hypothetical protein [Undibacterium rivi]MBR7791680.1 hypothetical protein [Undibacterium rivi]